MVRESKKDLIIKGLKDGLTTKQITEAIGASPNTISKYKKLLRQATTGSVVEPRVNVAELQRIIKEQELANKTLARRISILTSYIGEQFIATKGLFNNV